MELIDGLLKKWNDEHYKITRLNHTHFLFALMDNHTLSLVDLKNITGLSSGTVTQMLNYKIEIPLKGVKKLQIDLI